MNKPNQASAPTEPEETIGGDPMATGSTTIPFPPSSLILDGIRPSVTAPVKRFGEAGVVSVVNSKNGTRVSLAKELYHTLGKPESVQIGFQEGELIIGAALGDGFTDYSLTQQGAKQIIYNKQLVHQITNAFELDFEDRSSITFYEASYEMLNGQVIARISIKP